MNLARSLGHKLSTAVASRRSPMPGLIDDGTYRRLIATPPFTPGEVTLNGHLLAFSDVAGFLHSLQEIFVDEVYRFVAHEPRPHIVDAGANIGLSVLYFKHLYPDATVTAYEPDPQMFALLERNTAGLSGIELHKAAAWTEATELTFHMEGSLAGSTEVDFLDAGRAVTVAAERLRDALALRPVSFLKIDIEGGENDVLFDIEDELDRIDHLFFEYHSVKGRPQRLGDMLAMVTAKGFRYVINGCHGPRLPFIETMPRGFDLQLNVSCFRERRRA